jgi:hypothetical protein
MSDNVIQQLLAKNKISPIMVDLFKLMDPTKNKRFIGWIANQYIKNPDETITHETRDTLDRYLHYIEHNHSDKKDINKFKTIKELEDHVKELSHKKSTRELRKEKSLLFENEYISVYRPTTNDSCRQLVFSTLMEEDGIYPKWCIIPKNSLEWNNYWIEKKFTFYFIKFKKIPKEYSNDKLLLKMFNDIYYKSLVIAVEPGGGIDHVENRKDSVTERQLTKEQISSIVDKKWGLNNILRDIFVPYNVENRN